MSVGQGEAGVPSGPPGRARTSVLALPGFRWLWLGQAVSAIGDQIFPVAVALRVLDFGGTATDLGLVLAARSLALVSFLIIGGVFADRLPRTRVMVGSDLVRAIAVVGLALTPGDVPVLALAGLTFVVGAGEAFFRPAYGAVLPSVVPEDQLGAANGLTSISLKVAQIGGPALGALLVGVAGTRSAFLLDALTFGVSMLTLLRVAEPPMVARERQHPVREAAAGVRAVRERPWVGAVLVMACAQLMLCVAPVIVLQPVIARERFGGDTAFAAMLVAFALGGVPGAILTSRWRPQRAGLWAGFGLMPYGLLMLALAYSHSLPLVIACNVLVGFGLEPFIVWWPSALQREIPRELLARVISLDWMVSYGLMPVGQALTGPAVGAFGYAGVFWLGVGALLATTWLTMAVPGVMEFATPPGDRRPTPTLRPESEP